MVSSFQNFNLLRNAKREEIKTNRLDETKCISHLYNVLQIGCARSSEFSQEKMEIFDIGRGAEHQKFQIAKVAVAFEFPNTTVSKRYFRYII